MFRPSGLPGSFVEPDPDLRDPSLVDVTLEVREGTWRVRDLGLGHHHGENRPPSDEGVCHARGIDTKRGILNRNVEPPIVQVGAPSARSERSCRWEGCAVTHRPSRRPHPRRRSRPRTRAGRSRGRTALTPRRRGPQRLRASGCRGLRPPANVPGSGLGSVATPWPAPSVVGAIRLSLPYPPGPIPSTLAPDLGEASSSSAVGGATSTSRISVRPPGRRVDRSRARRSPRAERSMRRSRERAGRPRPARTRSANSSRSPPAR